MEISFCTPLELKSDSCFLIDTKMCLSPLTCSLLMSLLYHVRGLRKESGLAFPFSFFSLCPGSHHLTGMFIALRNPYLLLSCRNLLYRILASSSKSLTFY